MSAVVLPSIPASTVASLPPLHRESLAVMALADGRWTSRTRWLDLVHLAGLSDERNRKVQGEAFTGIVADLQKARAIVVNASDYDISAEWIAPILEDARRSDRLSQIAFQLRSQQRGFGSRSGQLGTKAELRYALAMGDDAALATAQTLLQRDLTARYYEPTEVPRIVGLHAPLEWVERLGEELRSSFVEHALSQAFLGAKPVGEGIAGWVRKSYEPEPCGRLATILALAGDVDEARHVLAGCPYTPWSGGAGAFATFIEGRDDARDRFEDAATTTRGRRVELPEYLAIFDWLLCATGDDADALAKLGRRMDKAKRQSSAHPWASSALQRLLAFRTSEKDRMPFDHGSPAYTVESWVDTLVHVLVDHWTGSTSTPILPARSLLAMAGEMRSRGFAWLAREFDRVAEGQRNSSFLALMGRKERWELALDALDNVVSPEETLDVPADAEIWWDVQPGSSFVALEAYLCTPRGPKGKRIHLSRLQTDASLPLDDHDRRIVSTVAAFDDHPPSGYPNSVLLTLVGHPRVREGGIKVEIARGEPRLCVRSTEGGARLALEPARFDHTGTAVRRQEDAARLIVTTITPPARRILEALGLEGVEIPRSGLGRLGEVLGGLSGLIGVEAAQSLVSGSKAGDSRIHVQLFRGANGLRIRFRVVPGGAGGTALRPGVPPEEIVVKAGEGLVTHKRDLVGERWRLDDLVTRCPTLASLPRDGEDFIARELETCLEVLVELGAMGSEVVLAWPEGKPIAIPAERSGKHVRVRMQGSDDSWLDVDARLVVDENCIIEMRELLDMASRGTGRFVPIGEGQWLALTEGLRGKLLALGRMRELTTDGRLSPALLPAFDDVVEGLDVSMEGELVRIRSELDGAARLSPRVPRDFAAELRDYQREGFLFLVRRAEAGLGACLADDMGLGKTVQTLALLLHRRKKGPALVLAPMSVCRNWEEEARRFAPSLRVHRLGEGDREGLVKTCASGDVVLASYGLLVSEEKLLASRVWSTVVFDEAHALKNATTRRAVAARSLDAQARIALTGTPVENRIGELHSLFDVLVPGLLGSRSSFDRTFGRAITDGDREATALLRRIVRPFVLRRTKAEVLSELPPKTELLRVVAPTEEQFAFYEAARRRALERMEAARSGARGRGQARIEILAELTRLRRAAIDPRLVGGEEAPPGTKIDALLELVDELRAEGHRALVFSQFLEVLDLAQKGLESRSIECLRLDGTMTADARKRAIDSFQSGQGDVFLSSLKAGGVGLNLTAADFVVLLDPWWNPAVEDQAADRAHRIGQSRPVTVARLVTEGTIEEKVLTLHASKRQLYEDVVADADGSGVLDLDALAALVDYGVELTPADDRRRRAALRPS
ncbi:SWF/SNF family helicase [Labilithrix luteola]|uniref:SWF/SNF family helicase n=1 Tax=Labilithrix luteola TaxID=1391654 RepID=A0A0K1Q992_9BACT|nr:DEAD/DEAH box helicase [Labilithrix luteola]AKV01995.1 SWF/SNF family helicase [Labilithrix luteola]